MNQVQWIIQQFSVGMPESEKYKKIHSILCSSKALHNFMNLVKALLSKHNDFCEQKFTQSTELKFCIGEINKLRLPELDEVLCQLENPNAIIALPVKIQEKFTLFFVIVPKGKMFNWHSHPKMTGISKCLYGSFKISAIDFHHLQLGQNGCFYYPKQKMRLQNISCKDQMTVSQIYPESFNIHKIEANELMAFFDLLMPDYPENTCTFFDTIEENEDYICLNKLQFPQENIRGLDVAISQMMSEEKRVINPFILK